MIKKQKLVWLLVCLITAFIFIIWLSNLKHILRQPGSKDGFVPIFKQAIHEINESFKGLDKNIRKPKSKTPSEPLTEEALLRLKEKILQYNEEKEEITK
ncbi:hypothetical protein ISS21_00560 [Patescibacteria group bacterium]|nr:hypothetical protein [Patescibacteria group bacterium]